ncbi:hypothetical protein OSB04_017414 [Centaurea solstitialis]|uniref:Uncharacterized protein n=1 Tax=Centaurea solstitialis TaxID=347529 RepID=A0AA38WKP7_9ASTR|nr:hypothetical protein OSB04_017414 [Centaurea solstitialis]
MEINIDFQLDYVSSIILDEFGMEITKFHEESILYFGRSVDVFMLDNPLIRIPKDLGNLCSLTSLSLGSNSAVVNFPDSLINLSGCTSATLRELLAYGSQFTGSLSNEIKKFSSLELFILSHNHLNGTMSEEVWELPNLQSLDVSSNSLIITPNIG